MTAGNGLPEKIIAIQKKAYFDWQKCWRFDNSKSVAWAQRRSAPDDFGTVLFGELPTVDGNEFKEERNMSRAGQESKTAIALSDGPVRNPDVVVIRKEQENRRYWHHLLRHTLSRKNLMALTGLFLCFFLVIHLFGNLQLLLPAEVGALAIQFLFQAAFREYFYRTDILFFVCQHPRPCCLCAPDHPAKQAGERPRLCVRSARRHQQMVFTQDGAVGHYPPCFSRHSPTRFLVSIAVWACSSRQRRTERSVYARRDCLSKRLVRADLCLVHGSAWIPFIARLF